MSDFTTPDQQATGALGVHGGVAHPLTYSEALHRLEACQEQLDESRMDYLSAKDFGNATSLFTAAVVLSEAVCLTEDARTVYQHVCNEDLRRAIQEEMEAAS
jgi:hypothetical protein